MSGINRRSIFRSRARLSGPSSSIAGEMVPFSAMSYAACASTDFSARAAFRVPSSDIIMSLMWRCSSLTQRERLMPYMSKPGRSRSDTDMCLTALQLSRRLNCSACSHKLRVQIDGASSRKLTRSRTVKGLTERDRLAHGHCSKQSDRSRASIEQLH